LKHLPEANILDSVKDSGEFTAKAAQKVVVETLEERIAAVRAFNRFYTNVIGILQEGLLRTPYSLTEARVIFELAQRDATELVVLRRTLGIDAGYLTRILSRFETDGLVSRRRGSEDARRQIVALTRGGKSVFRRLDARSSTEVGGLLSALSERDQRRLVGAMGSIRDILSGSSTGQDLVLRPPSAGDLGWVVQRHGALYEQEYGWDATFEALVARIVAEFVDHPDPQRERAWIAELGGERVGCVFCVGKDDATAQLRLLLVEPEARGTGIGSRLVEACIQFAKSAGYERMILWTNDVLADARRLYERAGFELVEEEEHHTFGHDLVGQVWSLGL
jgi:DNA-binding MarR family transcriptional regulator/GNAT superfamily N-acetyltransferase